MAETAPVCPLQCRQQHTSEHLISLCPPYVHKPTAYSNNYFQAIRAYDRQVGPAPLYSSQPSVATMARLQPVAQVAAVLQYVCTADGCNISKRMHGVVILPSWEVRPA